MSHISTISAQTGNYAAFELISCDWPPLRSQLLDQWPAVTAGELDKARQDRHRIALLIERKYGIDSHMVENYLRNFERTMPLAA